MACVDPTLVGELEQAGYGDSRDGVEPASVEEAIAAAPRRRPAGLSSAAALAHDPRSTTQAGTIERPPGVRLDSGGTGKGLAADMAAELLARIRALRRRLRRRHARRRPDARRTPTGSRSSTRSRAGA